jgi:UDP-N-acetylmuramoylalanine--D-glutamate ligase
MMRPDLVGKKVVVVGLGRTGEAAADFLLARGARVVVTDARPESDLPQVAARLRNLGAVVELGGHLDSTFTGADLILLSPGVPPEIRPLALARAHGVPITGEIELASRYVSAPIIAVTGTNGKTTVTSLLGEIIRKAGRKAFVGGNIGNPLIEFVAGGEEVEFVVLEVSSFQLETIEEFKPEVGLWLNATPDHLDRYHSLEDYYLAKARLFRRQSADDVAVLNADDPVVTAVPTRARRLLFSRLGQVESGAWLQGDRLVFRPDGGAKEELPLADIKLVGAHNQENIMAAVLCSLALGLDFAPVAAAVSAFTGLPHRVELVGEYHGVRYYDDSKGTNVGAVIKSLEGFTNPVILIAGGRDKAGDFRPLKELVRQKVKLLVLIGEAAADMNKILGGETETVIAKDMAEAVALSSQRSLPGDVVLLSPACASFDMFRDYGHRGRVFADLVGKVTD